MNLRLLVSEPWDFEGPDGQNLILATLDAIGYGKYGEWLVCKCKPFAIHGLNISSLLLTKRHKTKELMSESLNSGKEVIANAAWRRDGRDWDKEAIKEAEINSSIVGGWLILSARTT